MSLMRKNQRKRTNQTGVKPHRSTLFYYHKNYSEELFEYLEHLQFKRIEELDIKPSGIYCFDEQVRQEIIFFASQSVQETDDYHWLFLLT